MDFAVSSGWIEDRSTLLREGLRVAPEILEGPARALAVLVDGFDGATLAASSDGDVTAWEGAASELPGFSALLDGAVWHGPAAALHALGVAPGSFERAAGFPLQGSRRLLAVLYLLADEASLSDAPREHVVRLLCTRLAVLLERALLSEHVEARRRQFRQVLRTTAAVLRQLDFSTLAQHVVEGVTEVTDFRVAVLSVREGGSCRRVAAAGFDHLQLGLTTEYDRWEDILLPEYRIGEQSFLIPPDAPALWSQIPDLEPRRVPHAWTAEHGLITRLADERADTIGFLSVDEPRSGRLPSSDTVEVLELFAQQVQVAFVNARLYHELRNTARRDGLTGLLNHSSFWEELAELLHRDEPTCLAIVDLDDFKAINDRSGHRAGDEVLKHVADRLERNVRETDRVYRIGGEELCVLLPATATEEAVAVLARVRASLGRSRTGVPAVTLSVGIAASPQHGGDADALFRAADAALYAAKRGGRDRIEVAPAPADGGATEEPAHPPACR
jgi:diguanylate cyclase (GGDEF)-like protein